MTNLLARLLLLRCPTPRCRFHRGHAAVCADTSGRHLVALLRCLDCGEFFQGPPDAAVRRWRAHPCPAAATAPFHRSAAGVRGATGATGDTQPPPSLPPVAPLFPHARDAKGRIL